MQRPEREQSDTLAIRGPSPAARSSLCKCTTSEDTKLRDEFPVSSSCLMHLPVERDSINASSGIRSRSSSAALFRILPLSRADIADHLKISFVMRGAQRSMEIHLPSSKASFAEAMAFSMSFVVPAATFVMVIPLAGSSTSMNSPPSESTSSPLMKRP